MSAKDAAIQVILVPAGSEYQAVQRAMNQIQQGPQVIPIPAGPQAVQQFLTHPKNRDLLESKGVLLMGLGGSLVPNYGIGDGVLIDIVWDGIDQESGKAYRCDQTITHWLAQRLPTVSRGSGVTCDRVVTTVTEKRQLRDRYKADVIDMESAILLQELPNCRLAILRVISDDCHHDLPHISNVIEPDGGIKPIPMMLSFLQRPLAALRLIRGALKGLKTLESLALTSFRP